MPPRAPPHLPAPHQFTALELLCLSGNSGPVDPEALLAAAEAAPALHTVE